MVKTILSACFVLLLAIPALAQDDYPRIQTSMGYANLSFPDLTTGANAHHSGFANSTGLNLTRAFGVENYMGIYGVGSGSSLIADFIGGKATYRAAKIAPYALAGIGIGYLSSGYYGQSSFAARVGFGVDVPINDSLAWKVEYSRMNFHMQLVNPNSNWTNGNNIQAGIVITLTQ
ncbi:MAG TPA: outer membrane beta-barrel protein [Terriglobia bacterium]|nr:outer membrane beta-barrel protein [Terriglobia bacterium]